jgi:hypothetical protein
MGLLDKTNPFATRESVMLHAKIFGALAVVGYGGICIWRPEARAVWWFAIPLVGFFGGALGALLEWQLNDNFDIHDVVSEVNTEFGTTISRAECATIQTTGDLLYCLLAHPDADQSAKRTDEDAVWERLKLLLVKQFGYGSEEITRSTRFHDLKIFTYPEEA